ncbi:hypothetical protein SBA4_710017 [Candidatus Sulfopaludibacter sp. SbA4]|nr:hypothetical protein SBA4_710017 [Candidatus Sulfopaludibacter sp. SbA4]
MLSLSSQSFDQAMAVSIEIHYGVARPNGIVMRVPGPYSQS